MPFLAIGIEHKTAPLAVRERVALEGDALEQAALALAADPLIAEVAGKTAGTLIGYPLGDPEPIEENTPALLVPLHELMKIAPNTWYVHALAAYPEHRGHGVGAALLAEAEKLATAAGLSEQSLVVSDTNSGARRFYERSGYHEAARR